MQLPTVRSFCDSSLNRFTRLIALGNLQEHLSKLVIVLQECFQDEYHVESRVLIKKCLDSAFFNSMLEYVWKNWDDSFDPIIDQTKVIFKSVLDILDNAQGRFPEVKEFAEFKSFFMDDLVNRILGVDWNTKVRIVCKNRG